MSKRTGKETETRKEQENKIQTLNKETNIKYLFYFTLSVCCFALTYVFSLKHNTSFQL